MEPEYEPGSAEDFDRLYRDTYPRLVRTVYTMLRDAAAAEDCVQETFMRAYKAWPRFRPDRPAGAWLHQIAVNTAISYRRREKLREVGEVVRRFGRPRGGEDPAARATQGDIVAALRVQPPRMAAAFVMRHYHGYTNREIAGIVGVSERSIGQWLAHVRDDLRERLGEAWEESPELPTSAPASVDMLVADEP